MKENPHLDQQAARQLAALLSSTHMTAGTPEGKETPLHPGNCPVTTAVGAINWATTGQATEHELPRGMSLVIARWLMVVNDYVPQSVRDSFIWRCLTS